MYNKRVVLLFFCCAFLMASCRYQSYKSTNYTKGNTIASKTCLSTKSPSYIDVIRFIEKQDDDDLLRKALKNLCDNHPDKAHILLYELFCSHKIHRTDIIIDMLGDLKTQGSVRVLTDLLRHSKDYNLSIVLIETLYEIRSPDALKGIILYGISAKSTMFPEDIEDTEIENRTLWEMSILYLGKAKDKRIIKYLIKELEKPGITDVDAEQLIYALFEIAGLFQWRAHKEEHTKYIKEWYLKNKKSLPRQLFPVEH